LVQGLWDTYILKVAGKSKNYSLAVVVTLLIIVTYLSVFSVNAGEQAIVTQFGNVSKLPVTKPGLHLKIPFIQKVHYLPNHRVFELSTGMISNQVTGYGAVNIGQRIQYEIGEPLKYFVNFGTNLKTKDPIIQALNASLTTELERNVILEKDDSLYSQKRILRVKNGAEDIVLKKANSLLNPMGIKITKLNITIES
jgi:membrane protease subunit HflC